MASKTLCLNMIVKEESRVIRRCLESVKPIIDYWVIVDTGSTDGTQEIIKECMKNIPGELHERPWVNFEHNRNEALFLAQNKSDYIFFIDADEQLILTGFEKKQLKKQFYFMRSKEREQGECYKLAIIHSHPDWKWKGVLHEHLVPPSHYTDQHGEELSGIFLDGSTWDGNRSMDPKKYLKDASILKKELNKDPYNSRYLFYLAQTYVNGKEYLLALQYYHQRARMEGHPHEKFWTLYCIGMMQEKLEMDEELFLKSYQTAYEFDPARAEPLYWIARHLQKTNKPEAAYPIAKSAIRIPPPLPVHIVHRWVYDYGVSVLFAELAYTIGEYEQAYEACEALLAKPDLPQGIRDLMEHNLSLKNVVTL
jgi:glycosyltransferase involved in cell wall biosynthesis